MQAVMSMDYVSDRHSLIVLSFSSDPEAIMLSVGWQAVHSTVSVRVCACSEKMDVEKIRRCILL